ncbi:nucleoside-specific channel-forming protein [Robbsia andropogonis]|uniref:nucleoside-specific channel-forming protein Tsx n=1 Tax=Robbsia andropogonis TaxID=28092 RepID=UPI001F21C69C|nr:nucleoside-specific channel-forming protein Tsx [Robbsia andropogonis]
MRAMKRVCEVMWAQYSETSVNIVRTAASGSLLAACALVSAPSWATGSPDDGGNAAEAGLPASDTAKNASPNTVRASPHESAEAKQNPDSTAPLPAIAEPAVENRPWLHNTVSIINSSLTRFGPYRTGNTYLEYEYFGTKGPFNLYGYVDVLKVFNAGTKNTSGLWDQGPPFFSEQEPRVALDTLAGKAFRFGPFKHIYLASDWIYEQGGSRADEQNTLYIGLGTDIDTHTPLSLSANLYVNRNWQNYGAANEYSWDGYRYQMNYFYPIGHYLGGDWSYSGFFNYDFGSRLQEKTGGNTRTDNAFVETNALIYSYQHLRLVAVARYFHNGGQWSGSVLNFGSGNFQNRSTGWGYYFEVGYQWGRI